MVISLKKIFAYDCGYSSTLYIDFCNFYIFEVQLSKMDVELCKYKSKEPLPNRYLTKQDSSQSANKKIVS